MQMGYCGAGTGSWSPFWRPLLPPQGEWRLGLKEEVGERWLLLWLWEGSAGNRVPRRPARCGPEPLGEGSAV